HQNGKRYERLPLQRRWWRCARRPKRRRGRTSVARSAPACSVSCSDDRRSRDGAPDGGGTAPGGTGGGSTPPLGNRASGRWTVATSAFAGSSAATLCAGRASLTGAARVASRTGAGGSIACSGGLVGAVSVFGLSATRGRQTCSAQLSLRGAASATFTGPPPP